MQFTELSELNHVVGMMRIASCNSPTFHDRQDSEVDRIYNSSPKMEVQLRNSWIDKMTAFKPMPAVNAKKSSSPVAGASSSGTGMKASANGGSSKKFDASASGDNSVVPPTASIGNGGAAATGGKDANGNAVVSNGASTAAKRRMSSAVSVKNKDGASKGDGSDGKKDMDKKVDDGFVIEKEEVESISFHEMSLLDKILKGSSGPVSSRAMPMPTDSAVLHLTIYLPTRSEMKIDLYDVSTVDESIQEILRTHQAENRQPPLYYGHPECYELRLHDSDGYPDEDFPALDRSRKIKNFGDAGGHEYCLCERPDACPPTGDGTTDSEKAPAVAKPEPVMTKAPPTTEKAFLKIFMPKSDDYTVVAIDSTTTGRDLLPTLNKKHRLQLFQDQYVLKISEADRERLDLASDEIDMQTKLRPLNLHEVTIATKQYADAPQVPVTVTNAVDDATNIDGRSRPPPETFMFNDVTAAMFKEWHVIKKNKYGKKQHRMLGIDLNKTYNRKVGERVIKSRNTTKIAERPISSVGWVRFMQDPCDFQIYFKDNIEEIVTDYTADSPYECAEIVAKLKYILSRRK